MDSENRLIVFVDKATGRRSYKNLREADMLIRNGLGHIEGQEPQKQEAPKQVIVKQTKKKKQ